MSAEMERASATPLEILYRDEHLIAVHKPSGLLVHRTRLDAHEPDSLLQRLRRQTGQRIHPLHRLDKATSGVLLLALHADAAQVLSPAFASGDVDKTYLAVVRGTPPEEGLVDSPLRRQAEDNETRDAAPILRAARTWFRRRATAELPFRVDRYPTSRYSLVEARPETGRRHQIRRHLKHLSHPVIGDTTYGKSAHNRLFEEHFGARRLLLACVGLRFLHPVSGVETEIHAPIEGDFLRVVRLLGWENSLPSPWLPTCGPEPFPDRAIGKHDTLLRRRGPAV